MNINVSFNDKQVEYLHKFHKDACQHFSDDALGSELLEFERFLSLTILMCLANCLEDHEICKGLEFIF